MAGVIPGLLLGAMLIAAVYISARMLNLPRQERHSWAERLRTGRDAFWGLMLIVIILGGIYGGIFTPTEAAAVAAVYAFFVAVFIYKDLRLTETPRVILEAGERSEERRVGQECVSTGSSRW